MQLSLTPRDLNQNVVNSAIEQWLPSLTSAVPVLCDANFTVKHIEHIEYSFSTELINSCITAEVSFAYTNSQLSLIHI